MQGWLTSVWGVSSVIGTLAGGFIIQHVSWAWIFWINVPVGLVAAAGFRFFLRETVSREKRSVDVVGAVLFTVGIAALMLALTGAGTGGAASIVAALVCLVAAAAFVAQERRARDQMVAFALRARCAIATTNAATLLSGMAVIGLTTFLPMYIQVVLNVSLARGGAVSAAPIRHLLDGGVLLSGEDGARAALGAALHVTFRGVLLIAAATILAALLVPAVGLHQGARDDPAV